MDIDGCNKVTPRALLEAIPNFTKLKILRMHGTKCNNQVRMLRSFRGLVVLQKQISWPHGLYIPFLFDKKRVIPNGIVSEMVSQSCPLKPKVSVSSACELESLNFVRDHCALDPLPPPHNVRTDLDADNLALFFGSLLCRSLLRLVTTATNWVN